MKKFVLFSMLCAVLGFAYQVRAVDNGIQNFRVQPNESTLAIQWSQLSNQIMNYQDGYALWWSRYPTEMTSDQGFRVRHEINKNRSFLDVRSADFEFEKDYYFRICAYVKRSRVRALNNCSQMLKWRWNSSKQVTTEELISVSDPETNTSSSSSGGALEDFGALRKTAYDDYAVISWSRPNLTSSEFDGYVFELSDKNDMSNILGSIEIPSNHLRGRINGLTPETTYYIRAGFYKSQNGQKTVFGYNEIKELKTEKLFTKAQEDRIARLRRRGLFRDSAPSEATLTLSGTTSTSSSTTSSTSSSSSSSSSSTTTSSSTSGNYSEAEIRARIRELETELRTWRARLTQVTGSRTSRSRVNSSSSQSLIERIRARLRMRNQ